MRRVTIGLVVVVLVATVGIYAASITGSTKTLGGTGDVTVGAPSTTVSTAYTLDASNNVSAVDVTWTPGANSNYTIKVAVGASTGSASISSSGTVQRTDAVTISPVVAADAVSTVNVVITET